MKKCAALLCLLMAAVATAQPVDMVAGQAVPEAEAEAAINEQDREQATPEYRVVLERFSNGLTTLAGSFSQESYDDLGRLQESADGKFYLAAPDLFRWDYEQPFEQHIVADGRQVWVYDVDLEQITVKSQSDAEDETPLSLLTRPDALVSRFDVELSWLNEVAVLKLTPHDSESQLEFVEARLLDDALVGMQIVDVFGQRTLLSFLSVERNVDLNAGLFQFEPPEGIDVVGDINLTTELFTVPDQD